MGLGSLGTMGLGPRLVNWGLKIFSAWWSRVNAVHFIESFLNNSDQRGQWWYSVTWLIIPESKCFMHLSEESLILLILSQAITCAPLGLTGWVMCVRETRGAASPGPGRTLGESRGRHVTSSDLYSPRCEYFIFTQKIRGHRSRLIWFWMRLRIWRYSWKIIGKISMRNPMIPGRSMPAIFGRISSIVPWILRETRDGGFCSD